MPLELLKMTHYTKLLAEFGGLEGKAVEGSICTLTQICSLWMPGTHLCSPSSTGFEPNWHHVCKFWFHLIQREFKATCLRHQESHTESLHLSSSQDSAREMTRGICSPAFKTYGSAQSQKSSGQNHLSTWMTHNVLKWRQIPFYSLVRAISVSEFHPPATHIFTRESQSSPTYLKMPCCLENICWYRRI